MLSYWSAVGPEAADQHRLVTDVHGLVGRVGEGLLHLRLDLVGQLAQLDVEGDRPVDDDGVLDGGPLADGPVVEGLALAVLHLAIQQAGDVLGAQEVTGVVDRLVAVGGGVVGGAVAGAGSVVTAADQQDGQDRQQGPAESPPIHRTKVLR
jgi:hypothetical protein